MMPQLQTRTILQGDVLKKIKEIPEESIDCIITSPPYWGLRDYGVEGQWGLEPDFRDYLKKLQSLMNECKRILKKTGTCWINLGDTYSGSGKGAGTNIDEMKESWRFDKRPNLKDIQAKSRYGIPERFYIQCIDDGWIARNHCPWYKENAMPSSVTDRFTNKWESVFFFSKHQKYYFNLDAVREQLKSKIKLTKKTQSQGVQQKLTTDKIIKETNERKEINIPGQEPHGIHRRREDGLSDWEGYGKVQGKPDKKTWDETSPEHYSYMMERLQNIRDSGIPHDFGLSHPNGKNPGDVLFINPKPFLEAHFATFPLDLPVKILKCSCPQQVCIKCGKPREPIIENPTMPDNSDPTNCKLENGGQIRFGNNSVAKLKGGGDTYNAFRNLNPRKLLGWTKCTCNVEFKPGIVLDPFFGSGTVGVAAELLGLNWCGIELNPDYIEIAKKRLDPYKMEKLS